MRCMSFGAFGAVPKKADLDLALPRTGPVESWARTAKPVIPIPFAVVLVLEPPKGALS